MHITFYFSSVSNAHKAPPSGVVLKLILMLACFLHRSYFRVVDVSGDGILRRIVAQVRLAAELVISRDESVLQQLVK